MNSSTSYFPAARLRRMRQHDFSRRLMAENQLTVDDLQLDLDRRKPGTSRYTTARREEDAVKILSGVF